jgi:hypothetical protein
MQPVLSNPNESNEAFGDNKTSEPHDDTILFHNINGIKDESHWAQVITTMKELEVEIFGFAEINKSMTNFSKHKWTSIIQKQFYFSRMVHSESAATTEYEYKPGGTLTTVTGKWQARISEMGQDKKLGRWSYIKISSRKNSLIIITAYRPCKTLSHLTAWMQQWSLLREEGRRNPDPIKNFYKDISEQLEKWKSQNYEIILMMDANETLGDTPNGLGQLIGQHGLIDLILHKHTGEDLPSTYCKCSKIDLESKDQAGRMIW